MIISFTNVIGAIRSLGEAAQVITTNLKMWLGFETSETLGRKLVVNGDFATGDTTGWNAKDATISYDNGKLKAITTANANGGAFQNIGLVTGKYYKMTATMQLLTGSSNGTFNLLTSTGSGTGQTVVYTGSALVVGGDAVTETFIFTPGSGDVSIQFSSDKPNASYTIDNISVKELTQITPDKSGNNNVGELFTGKALEFNGTGDNVGFTFTTPVKSAVFWVKPLDTGLENILWFGGAFAGTKSIRSNGNVIQTAGLSSVSVYVDGVQTTSVPLNQWSRVVVNFASVTPSELKFGYAFNSYGYIQLSNVQLYNENLSTDDIAYDYANPQNLVTDRSGTSIELTNLKGYWHLSEGAGSTVYDSSGEGNNGTIYGATYEPAQPRIPQLGMMDWSKGSNLITYSEDFSHSSWSNSNITVVSGFTSPDGTENAYKLIENTAQNIHWFYNPTFSINNGDTYTISLFIKYNGRQWFRLFGQFGSSNKEAYFDIENGLLGQKNVGVTSKIEDYGDGWYRISASATSDGTVGRFRGYLAEANGDNFYQGDGTSGVIIWGAQFEESSSASAYRPTSGTNVPSTILIPNPNNTSQDIFGNAVRDRLNSFNLDGSGYAEVAEVVGLDVTDFSIEAWVKFDYTDTGSSTNVIYVNGGVSTSVNTFALATDEDNKVRFIVGGVTLYSTTVFSNNNWVHIAGTRESGALKLYINGNKTPEATGTGNAVVNNTSDLLVGRDTQTNRFYKERISDVRLYSSALSADQVENNYNAGLSAHTN